MESILNTIKKMLGSISSYTAFDDDIIVCINSAFSTLHQLGIGPKNGFAIHGENEKWSDFFSEGIPEVHWYESIKSYIYLKVKLTFDPPLNGSILEAYKEQLKELEWRMDVANVDNRK